MFHPWDPFSSIDRNGNDEIGRTVFKVSPCSTVLVFEGEDVCTRSLVEGLAYVKTDDDNLDSSEGLYLYLYYNFLLKSPNVCVVVECIYNPY